MDLHEVLSKIKIALSKSVSTVPSDYLVSDPTTKAMCNLHFSRKRKIQYKPESCLQTFMDDPSDAGEVRGNFYF